MSYQEQQKTVTFIAPTLTATSFFLAAIEGAKRELQQIENFSTRMDDKDAIKNLHEAQYAIHSILDGVNLARQITLNEFQEYQTSLANQQQENTGFTAEFVSDTFDLGPDSDD